jgi:hypothetical protein
MGVVMISTLGQTESALGGAGSGTRGGGLRGDMPVHRVVPYSTASASTVLPAQLSSSAEQAAQWLALVFNSMRWQHRHPHSHLHMYPQSQTGPIKSPVVSDQQMSLNDVRCLQPAQS